MVNKNVYHYCLIIIIIFLSPTPLHLWWAMMLLLQLRKLLIPAQSPRRCSGVPVTLQMTWVTSAGGLCSGLSCEVQQCCLSSPVYCSGEHPGACKSISNPWMFTGVGGEHLWKSATCSLFFYWRQLSGLPVVPISEKASGCRVLREPGSWQSCTQSHEIILCLLKSFFPVSPRAGLNCSLEQHVVFVFMCR